MKLWSQAPNCFLGVQLKTCAESTYHANLPWQTARKQIQRILDIVAGREKPHYVQLAPQHVLTIKHLRRTERN